jgi:RNA polymerase sigma factor (sigma-70 family)
MTSFSPALATGFRTPGQLPRVAVPSASRRSTLETMAEVVERSEAGLEAEEARLARAAAAGDGEAFATLYERYAQRAYNLALRLCGSDQDAADAVQEAFLNVMRRLPELGETRELAFGSYLFTATRNATYDLMRRQQRSQPSDSIPDSAVPLGAGAGGLGLDPGDPDEDPDRKALLAAQREEIAAANARLPERQREALALRELEEMSYDEIAAIMEMNRNSVAQLISRARIGLRDELRGSALASVAVSSPECERALPLIAARDDGQFAGDSEDATWLAAHMASCDTCRVASEAMQEAGVSYRAWIPVAVAPWLFKETMAKAAELSGSDWSEVAERHLRQPTDPGQIPGLPAAYGGAAAEAAAGQEDEGSRRRRGVLVGVLALLLLLGGAVVALSAGGGEGDPAPAPARSEVSDTPVSQPVAEPEPQPKAKPQPVEKKKPQSQPVETQAAPVESELPLTETTSPPATEPAESKTKTKAPPAAEPKGGEAGLDGSSVRDPAPESTPPSEPPPPPPPPAGEEEPNPPGQPPVPGGPGGLTTPPGPPKPG